MLALNWVDTYGETIVPAHDRRDSGEERSGQPRNMFWNRRNGGETERVTRRNGRRRPYIVISNGFRRRDWTGTNAADFTVDGVKRSSFAYSWRACTPRGGR